MSGVRVRAMIAVDAERVADLCTQLGYPSTAAEVAARFAVLQASSDHAVFVATDDAAPPPAAGGRGARPEGPGTVVGFVHVHQAATLEGGPWAEIGGLVIDQAARGRRIGQLLVAAAERWAVARRYPEMRVRSNVIRERAHEFYRRLGYDVVKTQVNFRKALDEREGQ